MIVIDEYLVMRVLGGRRWPEGLPTTEDLALPASRHWRLLQRIHAPGDGQLSRILTALRPADLDTIRFPHPEVLQVLDPRPLLDEAAQLAALHRGGWLIAETLAAGVHHGHALWFGTERNVGSLLARAADDLGITVHVVG
ncbi:MAG: hypothetical protein ACYDDZ_14845 [Acidimicrobiales bacterium]